MNSAEILQRVQSMAPNSNLDFPAIRNNILDAYTVSASVEERTKLLSIYKVLMDTVERQIAPGDLASFKEARSQDYNLLLVSECVDAAGNVSPQKLDIVTTREIAAGRMLADHELRKLADLGITAIPDVGKPAAVSGWRRAFSRGRKGK